MLPRVAIVYLSFNSRKYLNEVFGSLDLLDYPKDKLEIIVIDNASTDGSSDWLREKKGITFFPSEKNLGFAQGNNIGINHALLEGVEYVFLLNGDAKLHTDALIEAVRIAQSDEKIGSVQSRIMLWKNPDTVNCTGGMVNFLGFGFARDNGKPWNGVRSDNVPFGVRSDSVPFEEIAYSSGAAVLYRASVLQKVGVLDPYLFLYHEDLELGWRIRLAGYKNVLATQSIAYHDYEFRRSVQKFYWMERNRFLVHFSHLRLSTLLVLVPFMFASEIGLFFFAIKGGWIKEKFLVWIELLSPRSWRYVIKKRRETNFLRRVDDREIVKLWTGTIDDQETVRGFFESVVNLFLSALWCALKPLIRR